MVLKGKKRHGGILGAIREELLLREGEGRSTAYFLLLLYLVGLGLALGNGSANSLFLKRAGIAYLPYAYLGLSGEPTLGQRLTATPPRPEPAAGHASPPPAIDEDVDSQTSIEARAQRIVALRVVAPLPSRFEGSLLHEAVLAEHFEFGRYQIFHRLDPLGRAVLSLASLREPGTFDPATMAGAAYAGVAIFAVLPGPVPAQQAFEELLAVSRSLAGRLGGHMQDERGVPLTAVHRVARLREEMLAFDRGRADPARR